MSLGETLKAARLKAGFTLRAVEGETGISNGYLSQLESDSVKTPSPRHLFQLARAYGVGYQVLMAAADYPIPEEEHVGRALPPSGDVLFSAGFLTPDDENKVRGYIDALRSQYASVRAQPPKPRPDGEKP